MEDKYDRIESEIESLKVVTTFLVVAKFIQN